MTRDRRGHRRKGAIWAQATSHPGPIEPRPEDRVQRQGITPNPRDRLAPGLPLTDAQLHVLAVVETEPIGASELARRAGLVQVTSMLYSLADRGLVERVPRRGWRRI